MFGPDKCGNDNKVRALDYLSQIHMRPPLKKKLFPVRRPSGQKKKGIFLGYPADRKHVVCFLT